MSSVPADSINMIYLKALKQTNKGDYTKMTQKQSEIKDLITLNSLPIERISLKKQQIQSEIWNTFVLDFVQILKVLGFVAQQVGWPVALRVLNTFCWLTESQINWS